MSGYIRFEVQDQLALAVQIEIGGYYWISQIIHGGTGSYSKYMCIQFENICIGVTCIGGNTD